MIIVSLYSIYHYYFSNFYWFNIISYSRMQTDLMWINRHSIIIGLQSQEHGAESNFNDVVFFYARFISEHTFFSLYPVSCISPYLLCICTCSVWCILIWFYWISSLLQLFTCKKSRRFALTAHTILQMTWPKKIIYRQIETGN